MVEVADVAIIGAGVIGTSIAYHLVKEGVKKVVVLERHGIGSGATGNSGGLIRYFYSSPLLVKLALMGGKDLEEFEEVMGEDIDYVRNGLLLLFGRDDSSVPSTVGMLRELGVDAEEVRPEDLTSLTGLKVETDGIGGVIFDRKAAYADSYKVAMGYAKRSKEFGAVYRVGSPVTGIKVRNGRVTSVVTKTGEISAALVINAAGPWAHQIASMAGCRMPLKPISLQHLTLRVPFHFPATTPTIIDATGGLFFIRPDSGDFILAGIDREDPDKRIDPDLYRFCPSFGLIAGVCREIVRRVPSLGPAEYRGVYGAADEGTPDWNPIIGEVAEPRGFYLAVGFSGHGFKLAPAIGRIVAEQIVTGERVEGALLAKEHRTALPKEEPGEQAKRHPEEPPKKALSPDGRARPPSDTGHPSLLDTSILRPERFEDSRWIESRHDVLA